MPLASVGAPGQLAGTPAAKAIRVVVVDDSRVVRLVLTEVVRQTEGLELAGVATNGREAVSVVEGARPDVVVLDIEMPVLDGLGALRELKRRSPKMPVIMFSSLTERGAAATLTALAEGADDYLTKPSSSEGPVGAFKAVRRDLVPLLRTWGEIARARSATAQPGPAAAPQPSPHPVPSSPARPSLLPGASGALGTGPAGARSPSTQSPRHTPQQISAVVIGSSTGGPNALAASVPHLPNDLGVPVLLVQHMPPTFTKMLAERLNAQSALEVLEAGTGMRAQPDHLYVAPGGKHMVVARSGREVVIGLDDGPPENFCKPSVDVLFRSAAQAWGGGALGVVLTGMGHDGLAGSRAIVAAGGAVIAQDEPTSVVWGMPGAVTTAGVASEVLPIDQIAPNIVRRVRRRQ
ncbi:MAG TPA: chemotaxis-specific protein-glutamate methyltransferase CheB [Acidimicrobiales bacterium]|nr:chemotaxis-specific protein-glutamate methyltransferase CheB [Acidimicrobiales bacterium]